jgi:hypothetical protein
MPTPPEVERAILRAGSSPSQEEADRFYAQRVGDFARTIGVLFSGLYVVGAVVTPFVFPGLFWTIHLHPDALPRESSERAPQRRPRAPRALARVREARALVAGRGA